MEKDKKKALREQYNNRHPQMGIICCQCNDNLWVDMSADVKADFNGIIFQLKLGSWPNKELQAEYKKNPEECQFSIVKELNYEDYSEDHTDDLKILLMDFLQEYSEAKPLRAKFNL